MVWAAGNDGSSLDGSLTVLPAGILAVEQRRNGTVLPVDLQASTASMPILLLAQALPVQLHCRQRVDMHPCISSVPLPLRESQLIIHPSSHAVKWLGHC
jgi:hypothetical protein